MSKLDKQKDTQEGGNTNFKLLPDRPIEPDKKEEIRFGHNDITTTVFN
ncbi:MAG: hypothetical protein WDZ80_04435 [Candidatus Paceibacterota bacterium]